MKLKTTYWSYKLDLIEDHYRTNNKPYFWLYDTEGEEPFTDITVNLDLDPVYDSYNFIDRDFINCCFTYIGDCEKWLKKNLKIKEFWKLGDYYYFTL